MNSVSLPVFWLSGFFDNHLEQPGLTQAAHFTAAAAFVHTQDAKIQVSLIEQLHQGA